MNFTVITCTRNSMAYLPETIASLKKQTGVVYEHVFVDGNSTDGTLEYIRQLSGRNVILEGICGGISRAMNEGVRAASGDVIVHLHSDDYYLGEDVLLQGSKAMAGGAGWAFGRIVRDIDGLKVPEGYIAPEYTKRRLQRGNFIPHPATFVRRDWFNKVGGFDQSLKYAMDYDLWLKLAELGDPVEIDGALAAFRVHAGSLSTANRLAAMQEDYAVRKRHSGLNPLIRIENFARYLVRRRRTELSILANTEILPKS